MAFNAGDYTKSMGPTNLAQMLTAVLYPGRVVQIDPIKLTSKASGTKRLKLKYDESLSNAAFKFNLRRCNRATARARASACACRSSTCCALPPCRTCSCASRQGLTLVHFSAQLEPCLTSKNTQHIINTPYHLLNTGYTTPTRTPIPYKALKLS